VGEIIIDFTESPIQSLMNYVFENYLELEGFCKIEGESKNAKECGDCHHRSYFPGGNPKYDCDNFKRVYLLRYLPRQFEQNNFVIKEHVLSEIENKTDLSAVSLGGGPAPEALAIMDGLSSYKQEYDLFFDNIEREASWEDIYHDICHQFANYVEKVKLKTSFSCYDVTSYAPQRQYDLVFISWLFSDMRGGNSANVLQTARNLVAPQGYILIIDRYERALVSRISRFINVAKELTLVEHKIENVQSSVNYPSDIWTTFGPDPGRDFAYWVLQIS
jgi:hypothetical protein